MNRLISTFSLILLLAAAAAAQDWAWRNFSPPNNAFTISAPGPMNPDEEAQEPNSRMGSYAYSDFYGYFGVVYREWSSSFWKMKPDYSSHFKKVRNDFVKAGKGELLSEEKFVRGEVTGRNVRIKIPYGQITGFEGKTITKYRIERLRMFFVGKRFYLLIAVLPEDIIDSPAVNQYFDSFAAQ